MNLLLKMSITATMWAERRKNRPISSQLYALRLRTGAVKGLNSCWKTYFPKPGSTTSVFQESYKQGRAKAAQPCGIGMSGNMCMNVWSLTQMHAETHVCAHVCACCMKVHTHMPTSIPFSGLQEGLEAVAPVRSRPAPDLGF